MNRLKIILILIVTVSTIGSAYASYGIGDTIQALNYTINLKEINTSNQTIKGWTEISIVPKVTNLDYIPLDFKDLNIDSLFVDQTPAPYSHSGNRLDITLSQAIFPDDTVIVRIHYHGNPFHEAWGGFHFSDNYAFNLGVGFESIPHNLGKTWFPCIDDFTDRATYDIIGTAENGLTITAGGYLVNKTDNGDNTSTWHWRIPHPIPTYLASIAIGNYHEYSDIHISGTDTIPISIFVRPSDSADVTGSFVNLHQVIDFFEDHFGPYPFEKVGYTGTAIGAMEHASNIAYPHFAINGGTSYEYLYTHELAHMWFGNMVTCSTAEDMWLNEGWATFCASYYKAILYDHETFIEEMRATHKDVLQNCHVQDGGYWAVSNIPQEVTYGMTAYEKGGTVVNTLRNYLGDSVFFDAITAYINNDSIRFTSRSSEEMRDFLSAYTGQDMGPFFEAWVMNPGTPHFSIDSMKVTDQGSSFLIDLWFKQKYKGIDFLADNNRVEITFADEDFNLMDDTIVFSGATGHSQKSYDKSIMPMEPKVVFMDLFEKTNDATTDNFRYFNEPEEYTFPETYFTLLIDQLADSALIRTTHNWVEPDSLKVPIEGLTLSPYRHWKIEGIFPEGFSASGKFFYSMSSNLDNGLITSANDSIVILYREDASHEWSSVSQTRIGVWSVGNIIVDEILPGEYTLAVWDRQLVGIGSSINDDGIRIYPNPSRGKLNFEFPRSGNYLIKIYNEEGKAMDTFNIKSKKGKRKLSLTDTTGMLLVQVYENGSSIASRKVVLLK